MRPAPRSPRPSLIQFQPEPRRLRLWGHLAWALGWAAVMAAAWSIEPSPRGHGSHVQLGLQPCPSVVLFGRLCPGCGMTTAFAHMVRLDIVSAFRANAFGPLVFLAYGASAVLMGYGLARSRRLIVDSLRAEAWLLGFLLALLAYAGVRFWLVPAA